MDDSLPDLERMLTGLVQDGFSETAVGHAMEIWLKANAGKVERASFWTDGCGSTIACGSVLTGMAKGLDFGRGAGIEQGDVLARLGGLPEESRHCALLAVTTLKLAINDYLERKSKPR